MILDLPTFRTYLEDLVGGEHNVHTPFEVWAVMEREAFCRRFSQRMAGLLGEGFYWDLGTELWIAEKVFYWRLAQLRQRGIIEPRKGA